MSLMVTGVVSFLFKIFPKIQYMERKSNVNRASPMSQELKMLFIKNWRPPEIGVIPIFNMKRGMQLPKVTELDGAKLGPSWDSLHGLHTETLPQNFLLRTITRIHLCSPFSFPNANNYITNNYILSFSCIHLFKLFLTLPLSEWKVISSLSIF